MKSIVHPNILAKSRLDPPCRAANTNNGTNPPSIDTPVTSNHPNDIIAAASTTNNRFFIGSCFSKALPERYPSSEGIPVVVNFATTGMRKDSKICYLCGVMNIEILMRGVVIGLLASITLGPVGIMCIQRTLSKSRASGFISGVGAATADSISATFAYFFIAIISPVLENHMGVIKIVGGAAVAAVGIHYFLKNPVVQIRRNRAGRANLVQDWVSTFALTLTNPAFMLWLLVIFSALGVSADPDVELTSSEVGTGAQVILGFFAGAVAWWFVLTSTVSLFRSKFRPRHLLWINRIAGGIITSLGGAAIISAFI
jgi:threonine/homoserine/homoserine lactone efflux protein